MIDDKFFKINFGEYQLESRKTAIYPNIDSNFIYPTLGLAGEAGEICEKIKKIIRDKSGIISEDDRQEIKKELGDVTWYVANLASELNLSYQEIAQENIEKLKDRQKRNVLHGNGDNR